MKKIIVGFLVSYDYPKLKQSIPPVYQQADKIYLAIDRQLRTWKGNHFSIDDNFFQWLERFDCDNKIELYRDDFFIERLDPLQNDTRERRMLGNKMGQGNWLIQVDADEIFIDFKQFVNSLRQHDRFLDKPEQTPIQIAGFLINIYKYLEQGMLYVKHPTKVMLATNLPNYQKARNTKQRIIYTDNVLLHECLSRTEQQLQLKLENWGHADEINPHFLEKWKQANQHNYQQLKNLFYLDPKRWKSLGHFPTQDRTEIKKIISQTPSLKPGSAFLFAKNFGQWFKSINQKTLT